jgi:hypothetical protein
LIQQQNTSSKTLLRTTFSAKILYVTTFVNPVLFLSM